MARIAVKEKHKKLERVGQEEKEKRKKTNLKIGLFLLTMVKERLGASLGATKRQEDGERRHRQREALHWSEDDKKARRR